MGSKVVRFALRFDGCIVGAVMLGVLLTAMMLVSVILLSAEGAERANKQNAKIHADQYAREAPGHAQRKCAKIPLPDKQDCAQAVYDGAREQQRREYEIEADRDSAVWNEAMGEAAILGGLFGAVTIVLVFATFILQSNANEHARADSRDARTEAADAITESREANKIARDGVQAQLRAWVTIDLQLDSCSRNKSAARIATNVLLKNIGETPALRVGASLKAYVRSSIVITGVESAELEKWPAPMVPIMPGQEVEERFSTQIANDDIEAAVAKVRENPLAVPIIVIDAVAYYHTVFDAEDAPKRLTSVQYLMTSTFDPDAHEVRVGWLDKDGPVEPEQVRFSLNKSATVHVT